MAARKANVRAMLRAEKMKQGGGKAATTRIQSPLARYSAMGELQCKLCATGIKSEALWESHCRSKAHMQRLVKLKAAAQKKKQQKQQASQAPAPVAAAPAPSGLPAGFFDGGSGAAAVAKGDGGEGGPSAPAGVPAGFFDAPAAPKSSVLRKRTREEMEAEAEEEVEEEAPIHVTQMGLKDRLAYFAELEAQEDSAHGQVVLGSAVGRQAAPTPASATEEESSSASAIPKGFFDDAKKDNEARDVDMSAELSQFRSELVGEEALVGAATEEGLDQSMEDIDWQVQREQEQVQAHLAKVQQLAAAVKQKFQAGRPAGAMDVTGGEEEEEDSDEDMDESSLFDWRAKGI